MKSKWKKSKLGRCNNPGGEEVIDENPVGVKSNQEGNSKGNRRVKHKCPFPSCSAVVVHLPHHMRQKHKWNQKDAGAVLNAFGLRREKKRTSKKTSSKA